MLRLRITPDRVTSRHDPTEGVAIRRILPGARGLTAIAISATLLVGAGIVPNAAAAGPDSSDVVLVLDFSASILRDTANRNRFGAALERIADRVDATASDLVEGDATVSIVQFASRAADYPGCADISLLQSPSNVARFSGCLRSVAGQYRKGLNPGLTKKIGVDTNYVAAMQQAAKHLPPDSVRPGLILLTDGKHDVKGVPVGRVKPELDRLFGARTPFALLPVGMGLDPKERNALAAGLNGLKVTRAMPACVSGETFDWPQVVFDSADQAGNAVAVALQDATCTFTVAPTPTPPPAPAPAAVSNIHLVGGDGHIELTWTPASSTAGSAGASAPPAIGYQARCRPEGSSGDWIESAEGASIEPKTTVDGLTNGTSYECEVAALADGATGAWTPAGGPATPIGKPAAPAKPTVEGLNGALRVGVSSAADGVARYRYECSSDGGTTWPATIDAPPGDPAEISPLENGVEYRCRAFAANATGISEASPLSDAVRPCSSGFQCNPLLLPIVGGVGAALVAGLLVLVLLLIRGRPKGHVVAVVDVVHTANVGHGSSLGIAFERGAGSRAVTGIVAERGRKAEIKIRRLRSGGFAVYDRAGRHVVADGDPVVVLDSMGVRHSLVLRAFATNAASEVASRR